MAQIYPPKGWKRREFGYPASKHRHFRATGVSPVGPTGIHIEASEEPQSIRWESLEHLAPGAARWSSAEWLSKAWVALLGGSVKPGTVGGLRWWEVSEAGAVYQPQDDEGTG